MSKKIPSAANHGMGNVPARSACYLQPRGGGHVIPDAPGIRIKPGPRARLRTLEKRLVLLDAWQFLNWVRLR